MGYLIGGILMLGAAAVAYFLGVAAERRSLEAVAELDAPNAPRAAPHEL